MSHKQQPCCKDGYDNGVITCTNRHITYGQISMRLEQLCVLNGTVMMLSLTVKKMKSEDVTVLIRLHYIKGTLGFSQ